jgi:hypothetical protein
MKLMKAGMILLVGLAVAGLGACAGDEETPPMGDMPMSGMPESSDMWRHAHEADSMAAAVREHVGQMRELSPEQWHARIGEHVGQVSQMLNLMDRQRREMDMGMGMSDEQMGRMMGMTGEEHRRLREELQGLRTAAEELQTASRQLVRQRMPDHLSRLEGMAETMERSAAHMRSG